MRPNTALRELVDKLLQARPAYIAALRSHKPGYSRLVKTAQPTVNDVPGTSNNKRQLRSSRSASAPAPVSPSLQDTADLQVLESPCKRQRRESASGNSAAASDSISSAAKNKPATALSADVAACPICNRTFKAGRVLEAHVNRCIDNPPPPTQTPAVPEQQQQQQQQAQRPLQKKQPKGVPHVKVPAKIAFHLFNDRKLRDKLKDVNLPITGKRKVCSAHVHCIAFLVVCSLAGQIAINSNLFTLHCMIRGLTFSCMHRTCHPHNHCIGPTNSVRSRHATYAADLLHKQGISDSLALPQLLQVVSDYEMLH